MAVKIAKALRQIPAAKRSNRTKGTKTSSKANNRSRDTKSRKAGTVMESVAAQTTDELVINKSVVTARSTKDLGRKKSVINRPDTVEKSWFVIVVDNGVGRVAQRGTQENCASFVAELAANMKKGPKPTVFVASGIKIL